jgi:polar amino acid transport system substrate-binding protein
MGSLFALILACPPARADAVKPCEPDKLSTRYPGLVGKTIHVGQDGISRPFSFHDPVGSWSGLLPAVAAGRIDVMWDALYYTPERAKMVDYVLYATATDSAVLHKGNPKHIKSLDDLCGLRGMGGLGTIEIVILGDVSKKCTEEGKPALDITTYKDRTSGFEMIATNRGDVMLTSTPIAEAAAAEKSDILESGFTFLTGIKIGAGVAKGRTELEQAISDGIAATQATGQIAKIFTAYKVDPNTLIPPEIVTK